MKKNIFLFLLALVACNVSAQDPVEIKLPNGFQATVVAKDLGRARHIAMNSNGDLFVKLERLQDGKGILRLRNEGGTYKVVQSFGDYIGTGIAVKDHFLYASSNSEVFKYKLNDKGEVVNPDSPEKIVTGLLDQRQHASKSITLDDAGNIYVNIGAPSNVCQEKDRQKGSPGLTPCPILEKAGGIWKFSVNQQNQSYEQGIRYATGLRNVVGLDWNRQDNSLYVTMHGRDNLHDYFPEIWDSKTGVELPAETMYKIKQGDDAGWPYVHYDHFQKKKILSPEYGGDGKKTGGEKAIDPIMAFPGHMAPNALLFYNGNMFPEKYKHGAFIAFHGSWNRSPQQQEGYYVVFVPFKNGKPTGDWEVFADGFAGVASVTTPRMAQHRPCGLAEGPDGSIYVSDSVKGFIWKITYNK